MTMVFIPRESHDGETRVAATPETVKRMVKLGLEVSVESGAGDRSYFADSDYAEAGAQVSQDAAALWGAADVVAKVNPPREHPSLGKHELELMKEGALFVGFVYSVQDPELAKTMETRGVSCLAMEAVPRISRAQKMDALSSQSNLAGYKAVLLAASHLPRIMPMLVTAAGTIKPAKVVVMGAGVAGLQAIATARRLGAVVEATDIRPAVKEEVESLGAKFIDIPTDASAQDEGGYARQLTPEQLKAQQELVKQHLIAADAVVTTALVPGRKAPVLVPADVVEKMKPGSVIVDLAVEQGGNCALSKPGEVVEVNGVKIVGVCNVPGTMAADASAVYSRNVLALLSDLVDKESKQVKLDLSDEVVDKALIVHEKVVRHGPTREALGLPAEVETPAAKDEPAKDEPAKDEPAKDASEADEPAKDESAKDASAEDESGKDASGGEAASEKAAGEETA